MYVCEASCMYSMNVVCTNGMYRHFYFTADSVVHTHT
jgi:hypothetical protein